MVKESPESKKETPKPLTKKEVLGTLAVLAVVVGVGTGVWKTWGKYTDNYSDPLEASETLFNDARAHAFKIRKAHEVACFREKLAAAFPDLSTELETLFDVGLMARFGADEIPEKVDSLTAEISEQAYPILNECRLAVLNGGTYATDIPEPVFLGEGNTKPKKSTRSTKRTK